MAMASIPNCSAQYDYRELEIEKGDVGKCPDRISIASENESLIGKTLELPLRSRRNRLAQFLSGLLIGLLARVLMIAVLAILAVATLTLVQRQNEKIAGLAHGNHSHGHPIDLRGPNGLRTTDDGRLIECGETAEAAKANCCPFDSFTFSYVPQACFEETL
jgi:hypothetical protein